MEQNKSVAEEFKTQGNSFFEKKEYIPAAESYGKGIEACPSNETQLLVILHSNLAAANLKMENFGLTISGAKTAIILIQLMLSLIIVALKLTWCWNIMHLHWLTSRRL
jgi:hypothetical protein